MSGGGSRREVNTQTVLQETDLDAVVPHGDSQLKSALKQSASGDGATVPKETEIGSDEVTAKIGTTTQEDGSRDLAGPEDHDQ